MTDYSRPDILTVFDLIYFGRPTQWIGTLNSLLVPTVALPKDRCGMEKRCFSPTSPLIAYSDTTLSPVRQPSISPGRDVLMVSVLTPREIFTVVRPVAGASFDSKETAPPPFHSPTSWRESSITTPMTWPWTSRVASGSPTLSTPQPATRNWITCRCCAWTPRVATNGS